MIAAIVISSIGGLLLWLVGIAVVVAIVFAILRTLGSPGWMFTALYVIALLVLLLLAISFFFGGGDTGTVIVR